jgi:hypothetical protein
MTPKDYLAHASRLSRELEAYHKRTEAIMEWLGDANDPQMDEDEDDLTSDFALERALMKADYMMDGAKDDYLEPYREPHKPDNEA